MSLMILSTIKDSILGVKRIMQHSLFYQKRNDHKVVNECYDSPQGEGLNKYHRKTTLTCSTLS